MARRPLTDPIADAISGLSQAVTSGGDNQQWQQNVTQTTEQFTGVIADAVVERITPTITNATRRTSSSSRSRGDTASEAQAASNISGNVLPGHTFQPSVNMDDIPDLNNPPRNPPWWFNRPDDIQDYDIHDDDDGNAVFTPRPADQSVQSRHAEEARRIVEDIANTATATAAANGNIPPTPPGNGPPEPPEPPDDDDNNIQRMLLEYLRRLLGIDFGDLANIMSRLTMNATNIIGGNNSMNVPNGPAGHAANLMDTIADYFNVPRETEAATIEAQEHLRRSIDRLTEATEGASGTNPAQPQGRFARIRSFFSRGRGRRGGMATATRIAARLRPVLNGITNMVPSRWRTTAARFGTNAMAGLAQRFGIPAATAARFGAVAGPALAIGIVAKAIPIIGTAAMMFTKAITSTISSLHKFSSAALHTTLALAEYNVGLSHANAMLEYGRTMRKFELAARNEGFGAFHVGQRNRLENAIAPWQTMGTNASSILGGAIDFAMAQIVEQLNTIIGYSMKVHASLLMMIPGDQGEAGILNAADKFLNPGQGNAQPWQEFNQQFGMNAPDAIDIARRLQNRPRQPVNPNGAGR
jgi:hypothetical protein